MKNKKKLIILSIVLVLLIVVLSSASYAYFTTTGSTGTEETITSGTMALTFTDGPQINATNLAPGDYIEKTFSVTNTGTLATTYDVYLSEVVNTFVQKNDLVYEITSNDGGYNTVNQVVVPNQESKIVDTQSIGVGATHHYTLRITYKLTNQIQNDNMGRGFTAKININEYNLNNTEKLLKLLDTSGNLVDKQMISSGVTDYYYNLANTSLTGTTNIYCNNGGIPTILNNQLIVSGLTVDTECKMSSDIADTINSRLTTSKTGIVMTNNQDNVVKMTVASGKEIVMDLNGKEIKNIGVDDTNTAYLDAHLGLRINGKATLNDSIGTGGIFTGTRCRALDVQTNGILIVNGGNYNGRQSVYLAKDNAYAELNGGNFSSKLYQVLVASDNNTGASLVINGGTYNGTMNNQQVIEVTDGTIDNTVSINGGTFYGVDKLLFIRPTSAIININNGTFNSTGRNIQNQGGTINIYDGDFSTGNGHNILNNVGTVNITGGKFVSGSQSPLYNRDKLNINQSSKPIYISVIDSTTNDSAGIYSDSNTNSTDARVSIVASRANKCTTNSSDTTSGLCIYYSTLNTSNSGFTIKSVKSIININGGTFISNKRTVGNESGTINIKNASVISTESHAIYNGNWFLSNSESYVPGTINICSSNINGDIKDLYEQNLSSYITYSNDNVFSNGTNTPDSSKVYGPVTATGASCSW